MGLELVKSLPQSMLGCSKHQGQCNTTDHPENHWAPKSSASKYFS